MLASLPTARSVHDILEEISYTRILLESLDDSAADYDDQKRRLEMDVEALEAVLKAEEGDVGVHEHERIMKEFHDTFGFGVAAQVPLPGQTQQRPHTSQTNTNFGNGFAALGGSHPNGLGGHFASDGVLMGNGLETPSWSFAPLEAANSTPSNVPEVFPDASPDSTSSPGQTTASSSPALPTLTSTSRKRQRQSLNLPYLATGPNAKSMRTTPSPAITGPTSPSSFGSLELPDDDEFLRLMGGNPREDLRQMHKEQKETERILRERREMEARDEEIARQLMQQWEEEDQARPLPESSTQAFADPNQLSQRSSQAVLDASGVFRRPDRPSSSNLQFSSPTDSLPVKQEHPFLASANLSHVGQEQRRPVPTTSSYAAANVIDLGDDSDSDPGSGHPSSDLVEIDHTSFQDSARKSGLHEPGASNSISNQNFANKDTFVTNGSWMDIDQDPLIPDSMWIAPSNPYQHNFGIGGTSVYDQEGSRSQNSMPGSNTWIDAAGRVRQGIADVAKGVYNGAYSLLDQQLSSYPSATPGYGASTYGRPYGASGSSTNPYTLGDTPLLDPYARTLVSNLPNAFGGSPYSGMDPKLAQAYVDRANYLAADPTRTKDEIRSLLENIRPDEDLPPQNREGTPEAMKYPLMEHQKLGLTWMKNMEEGSNKGGILADDMGLGKTIQALALMVSRRSPDRDRKTTLIVAPVALMKQWEREIQVKLKPGRDHQLSCFILHGNKRNITWQDLKQYDVVLTTFGTLGTELKRKEQIDMCKRANPNWQPTTKADILPLLGDDCKWYR